MRKSITDEQSPAFQFYANDWISDPNRMKLSLDEQGAYILLYCHCWRGYKILNDLWKVLWWTVLVLLIIYHLFIIQIKKLLGIYNGGK